MKRGSSSGKRKLDEARPVKNTMLSYFKPAAAAVDDSDDTPEDEVKDEDKGPDTLFGPEESRNWGYVNYAGRKRAYRISQVTTDGKVMGGCAHCLKNKFVDILQFVPLESNTNCRKRPKFLAAVDAFEKAYAARDVDAAREEREKIEEYRNALCLCCQKACGKRSPAQQACKDEYERMRKEACARNDGCANQDCAERGPQAWCVLHGDHLHTKKEEDDTKRKTMHMGTYTWWSGNGGVEAMREEEAKGMRWICGFCHQLEKTSSQANRCPHPNTMPDGRQGKRATEEEVKQRHAKRHANITHPKYEYVDERKRAIGCCQHCGRTDVTGREWAYHFDHVDETTKMKGKDTLACEQGGVSGLCANNTKKAALDYPGFQQILDREMDLCRLLCHNCHHRRTWGYPPRTA